jgi:hypothetical protein
MNCLMAGDRDPQKLAPWLPYVKLLTRALYSLPPQRATVFRGVQSKDLIKGKRLIEYYKDGTEKTWLLEFIMKIIIIIMYMLFSLF